jgi:hypothetical protein
MTALKNQRQELFAQGLVEGKTGDKAYADAGYKANRKNAARLKSKEVIQTRVAELQAHHQRRHDVTVDGLTTKLEATREMAMDTKQPAAATGAIMATARLHGLDKSDAKVAVNVQQNTAKVELSDKELARRMAHIIEAGVLEDA